MSEGELRGFRWRTQDLRRQRDDLLGRGVNVGNEVATAELDGASGDGGRAVPRDDDADEIGGIGGRDCHRCNGVGAGIVTRRGFSGLAQRFDGLWKRELFTLEAGDEAAAANDSASFEAA
jgi:hypothetical protein